LGILGAVIHGDEFIWPLVEVDESLFEEEIMASSYLDEMNQREAWLKLNEIIEMLRYEHYIEDTTYSVMHNHLKKLFPEYSEEFRNILNKNLDDTIDNNP